MSRKISHPFSFYVTNFVHVGGAPCFGIMPIYVIRRGRQTHWQEEERQMVELQEEERRTHWQGLPSRSVATSSKKTSIDAD